MYIYIYIYIYIYVYGIENPQLAAVRRSGQKNSTPETTTVTFRWKMPLKIHVNSRGNPLEK